MVIIGVLLYGDCQCFFCYDECEYLLVLQLGGSVLVELVVCVWLVEEVGYDEVNFNVGCFSDWVQYNMIGVCLMGYLVLVVDCVKVMLDVVEIVVMVKYCIGINGCDSYVEFCDFVGQVCEVGCWSFMVYVWIVIFEGFLFKENCEVLLLCYEVVV